MESIVKPIIERAQEKLYAYWKNSNRRVRVFEPESWRNKRVALISAADNLQNVQTIGELCDSGASEEFKEIMKEVYEIVHTGAKHRKTAKKNMDEVEYAKVNWNRVGYPAMQSPLLELNKLYGHYKEKMPKFFKAAEDAQEAMESRVQRTLE
ncbi:hypothetical protein CAEBREN_05487 [Caenorhabditis brenneri]|uniref:Uncharacterized protein n=1 Tax=Caenorhabditis brenneri TaxID=135651 RepID=G0NNQ9_CAEBE|nr:hypothetical protein CAEBREN_05487 [Caenorhabditis brenneri]